MSLRTDKDCNDNVRRYEIDLPTLISGYPQISPTLATNLPPTQVFPALRNLIQYFSSPDPNNRRGAMLALGVAVEGCSEYTTLLMSHVWPIIDAGLADNDSSVRKATCIAVMTCQMIAEIDTNSQSDVLRPPEQLVHAFW